MDETANKNETKSPWQWYENDLKVTRSVFWTGPGCHEGCGVLFYTDSEGKLVKVEGDPDNNFNQGRLCMRCLALKDVVNNPTRLKYPMKRVGKKGEDKWERISWDEALDTIADKFNKIKREYGPESVLFAQGTGRDIPAYIQRLAYSFGSPNRVCMGLTGNACYLPRVALMMSTHGGFCVADAAQHFKDRYQNPQWKRPEVILIWGNNPIVSNSDGFYGHWIVDMMKLGSKLIVVDPRLTWLASKAALWLPIRPGTDAALALGMINIIIKEGLIDKEFIDNWTYGFDKLAERAADYTVEYVSQITWLPKEKIIQAARMYAQAKPACIQWGVAIDMTKESFPAAHAISALWNITGNLDVPGGNVMTSPPFFVDAYFSWGQDLLTEEQDAKRLGLEQYPFLSKGIKVSSPDTTIDAIFSKKPYPIKAAWIQTNNPIACMAADTNKTFKALKELDFVVVVDLFMTPTAMAFADIILPAATGAERNGVRCFWYSLGSINKVTQIGECKSDMEINLLLGKRLNPDAWPWDTVEDMFDEILKPAKVCFEDLQKNVQMIPGFTYKKYEKGLTNPEHKLGFNTPTGKVELYSTIMEHIGLDPLPYFEEPLESPYSTPELYKEYPLIITTGARKWGYFDSEHRQIKSLRSVQPDPLIEIHPETALQYGIHEGDWVWIENQRGKCQQRAHLTPTIPKWLVSADHGWWFPEETPEEPHLFGVWKSNVNQLIPYKPGKSGFGGNYKAFLCKVYKVDKTNN
ncbi:dehydrogenase [Enterocloster clostridioformis]|nr:dehydrogenase [Lachnoclostridium sp. YL32]NDO29442.1 molybdopterin-dependent oxidoreductase [Enterocloster clostridioformis]OXE68980.1 dehydrogenase [Enterocloster clostridioformis]QQR02798.1 molybdopterin-dependent oxidoreductase [Enterocloster clostridioformis]